jgi:hypothetical protein
MSGPRLAGQLDVLELQPDIAGPAHLRTSCTVSVTQAPAPDRTQAPNNVAPVERPHKPCRPAPDLGRIGLADQQRRQLGSCTTLQHAPEALPLNVTGMQPQV